LRAIGCELAPLHAVVTMRAVLGEELLELSDRRLLARDREAATNLLAMGSLVVVARGLARSRTHHKLGGTRHDHHRESLRCHIPLPISEDRFAARGPHRTRHFGGLAITLQSPFGSRMHAAIRVVVVQR